jgi:hypothetical protein
MSSSSSSSCSSDDDSNDQQHHHRHHRRHKHSRKERKPRRRASILDNDSKLDDTHNVDVDLIYRFTVDKKHEMLFLSLWNTVVVPDVVLNQEAKTSFHTQPVSDTSIVDCFLRVQFAKKEFFESFLNDRPNDSRIIVVS